MRYFQLSDKQPLRIICRMSCWHLLSINWRSVMSRVRSLRYLVWLTSPRIGAASIYCSATLFTSWPQFLMYWTAETLTKLRNFLLLQKYYYHHCLWKSFRLHVVQSNGSSYMSRMSFQIVQFCALERCRILPSWSDRGIFCLRKYLPSFCTWNFLGQPAHMTRNHLVRTIQSALFCIRAFDHLLLA